MTHDWCLVSYELTWFWSLWPFSQKCFPYLPLWKTECSSHKSVFESKQNVFSQISCFGIKVISWMHKSAACSHVQMISAYISAQKIGKIRSTFLIKSKIGISCSMECPILNLVFIERVPVQWLAYYFRFYRIRDSWDFYRCKRVI